MFLFHIILKLIQNFHLATTVELQTLKNDVVDWESTATLQSENKLKKLYAKIHEGVGFRLFSPFLYVLLVKWVNDQLNPTPDDDFPQLP